MRISMSIEEKKPVVYYTYLHCKPDGTPFWVGKGKGRRAYVFNRRNKRHKNVVAKYGGKKNILVYIFPCESEQQALDDEIQQIAQLRRDGYVLCNKTDGGEGISGHIHTAETKAKISAVQKKHYENPEEREKMSAANKIAMNRPEVKAKNSAAQKKYFENPEAKAKHFAAQNTPEARARNSATQKIVKNTPEAKAKTSAAMKKVYENPEARERQSAAQKTAWQKSSRGLL